MFPEYEDDCRTVQISGAIVSRFNDGTSGLMRSYLNIVISEDTDTCYPQPSTSTSPGCQMATII